MNKNFKVNYLARSFGDIKQELKNYSKRYYGDKFADLSESSINSFLIDSVAYVGDILSYYTDYQANESFLSTAVETKNIINLAKEYGFKIPNASSTTGYVAVYVLIPANLSGAAPDYTKAPIIKKGTVLSAISSEGKKKYLLTEDIVIDENRAGKLVTVARVNSAGSPEYYAVKVYAPIISGEITTSRYEIKEFKQFNKIKLSSDDVVEVISIVDNNGNEYYQVPNLSQNIIYKSFLNTNSPTSDVVYDLRPISIQRRFVFEYDGVTPYIIFGGKEYSQDGDLTTDPVAEPSKFILQKFNNDHLSEDYFEPQRLINGDTFGIGPSAGEVLTVTYRRNTTMSNAESGEVNSIDRLSYTFMDGSSVTEDEISTIIQNIQVVNEEPIVGENTTLEASEIKQISGLLRQSQNRAVTGKDYESLVYTMPQKYGSVKRVAAVKDSSSLKNNINLYVICQTNSGLVTPNLRVKENIKNWLMNYKMITDTIDVLSAKVINLTIDYKILVDPTQSKALINNFAKQALIKKYSLHPQIGENFNKLDVYRELRKISGILDVIEVNVNSINGSKYSQVNFNVYQNETSDGNMIFIPKNAIYEIKYPDININGVAV